MDVDSEGQPLAGTDGIPILLASQESTDSHMVWDPAIPSSECDSLSSTPEAASLLIYASDTPEREQDTAATTTSPTGTQPANILAEARREPAAPGLQQTHPEGPLVTPGIPLLAHTESTGDDDHYEDAVHQLSSQPSSPKGRGNMLFPAINSGQGGD